MKNRYALLKYAGIAALIFVTFLYLLVYFLPTLKAINRLKRDIKDQARLIDDYRRTAAAFTYPDERERQLLQSADDDVRARLPQVRNREEFITLFTRIFADFEARARRDRVSDLIITSLGPDLQANAAPLSSGKAAQDELLAFFGSHLGDFQRRPGDAVQDALAAPVPKSPFLSMERLDYQAVYLTLSAPLPSLLAFVNHLPRTPVQVEPYRVWVGQGGAGAALLVEVRVYFLDMRPADAP